MFVLTTDLTKSSSEYSEKQQAGGSKEKTLINLGWTMRELTDHEAWDVACLWLVGSGN